MGKHRLVPHLIVDGGLDAIDFYERAFDAEKVSVALAADGKRVMHAELEINKGTLSLSDAFPEMSSGMTTPEKAGSVSVSLHLDFKKAKQVDEAIQKAVKAGATSTLGAHDAFWGARYGRVRDPFGHIWAFHAWNKKKDSKESDEN